MTTTAQPVSTTYLVSGMTCGHCVAAVTAEVRAVEGVTAVDVDLASGRMAVRSAAELPFATVQAAVDEAGYTVVVAP